MPQARDEAGNIWEVDAQGNPVRLLQAGQSQPQQPTVTPIPESPSQRADRVLRERAANNASAQLGLSVDSSQRAERSETRTESQNKFGNTAELRKEFNKLPSVQEYQTVIRQYSSALRTQNNPSGDQALITAYAKMLDPGSVVREQEFNTVANADSSLGRAYSRIAKELGMDGGGMLRPEIRERVRNEMQNLVKSYNKAYNQDRARYGDLAERNGIAPQDVVGPHIGEPYRDEIKQFWDRKKKEPLLGGGPEVLQPAEGETYSTPEDIAIAKEMQSVFNSGGSVKDMAAVMSKYGRDYTPQQAAEWQNAINYRDGSGEYAGQKRSGMPQVQTPKSGKRNMAEQAWGDVAASPTGAAGISAGDAYTMGLLDEIVGGVNAATGGDYTAERDWANMAKNATMEESPWASAFGGMTGGLAQGGISASIAKRALPSLAPKMATLPGAMIGGAGYGAAYGAGSENDNRVMGAVKGAGIGAAGGAVGAKLVAPIAERVMRTMPMQQVSKGTRAVLSRLGANVASQPDIPRISGQMRTIGGGVDDAQAALANLNDAVDMGLPYSLADSAPKLRMLGGAAVRKSPDARALAENTLDPRHLDQAARANESISRILAPVTDIAERGQQWKQAAQTASGPYYAQGMARAAPVDDRVAAFLDTTAGKKAMREAYDIASNEGRDPKAMGFDLNEQGEVFIRDMPSYETLDLVKRGFDAQLSKFRNPVTGKLDIEGNPAAQALDGLRKRFVSTLDELNPDYQKARAAYEGQIRNRDALEQGAKATKNSVRPRDIPRITDRMDDTAKGEFQRGYATSMADAVNDTKMTGDPYSRIYGSTSQREKVGSIFPENAPKFDRLNTLERDMAKTRYEALGGSPTAGRQQADQAFAGDIATMGVDGVSQMLTGGGASIGSLVRAGARPVLDAVKFGIGKRGEQNAAQIADVLFDTNPQVGRDALVEYMDMIAKEEARKRQFSQQYGLLGSAFVPAVQPMTN